MKTGFIIPRLSLIWLMSSLTLIILPHVSRMPMWLNGVFVCCIIMRILIFQGRLSYPGRKLKTLIVFLLMGATVMQYGRDFLATDTMIGILLVGIALKLLEMHRMRDVLVILLLNYFAAMSEFIYAQSIPVTVYVLCSVLLNTAALMSLQQNSTTQKPLRTMKMTTVILVQAVPLMLLLFVLFPRISPLWSMPIQSSAATTGLSDSMNPGDIGQLMQNADVAFKVQFVGDMPENSELYWRGLTLDLFNGRTWTRRSSRFDPARQSLAPGASDRKAWYQDINFQGRSLAYNVILEPTNQNWLYGLQMPRVTRNGFFMNEQYQLESRLPITQRLSYDVNSYPDYSIGPELDPEVRRRSLILPQEGNSLSQAFATELYESVDTDREYINAILDHFNRESFFYTLSPRTLGADFVDEFLFESREGFCEHFASSFTFLMRAAGVPARVVTGYQGGERNPYDDTLIVRQFDAHAWSEVWLEGEGWVRVDPTASVAPQRITLGSELTYQQDESFLRNAGVATLWMRRNLILNELRLYVETIDYAWTRFVVNYDQQTQFGFFNRLFGSISRVGIMLVAGGALFMVAGLLVWVILAAGKKKQVSQPVRYYRMFCRILEKMGTPRHKGETPAHYCERAQKQHPDQAGQVGQITTLFSELAYVPGLDEERKQESLRRLRMAVKKFRIQQA